MKGILLLSGTNLFLVRNQHLFLISRLDDMALWPNGDVIILSEILLDQSYWGHFVDDSSDVDWLALYLFDDVVIVGLEVFVVLLGNTVFNKIGAVLDGQFLFVLWSCLDLAVEDIGQFRLLVVALENPSAFLLIQQAGLFLVEPSFIVVYDIETFDHLRFVELVT